MRSDHGPTPAILVTLALLVLAPLGTASGLAPDTTDRTDYPAPGTDPGTLAEPSATPNLKGAAGGHPSSDRPAADTGTTAVARSDLPGAAEAGPRGTATDPHHSGVHPFGALPPLDVTPTQYAAAEQEMEFYCPGGTDQNDIIVDESTGNRILGGCPIRIQDQSFGNMELEMWDGDHTQAAFFSLHGSPTTDGQTDVSRSGQTHTTFSADNLVNWRDQWTDGGFPEDGARGESATGTIDGDGNMHVGYTWSRPSPSAEDGWSNFFMLFKGGTPSDADMRDNYDQFFRMDPRDAGNTMQDVKMVRVPDALDEPREYYLNDERRSNETEDRLGEDGEKAIPDNATQKEVLAVTWLELAGPNSTGPKGYAGWIDAVLADPHTNGTVPDWRPLNDTQVIGPCKQASDPVVYAGDIYIACTAAKDYDHKLFTRVGDHHIWRIDGETGRTELVADTHMNGGDPKLAVAPDGYMVIATVQKERVGEIQRLVTDIQFGFGWYGGSWSGQPSLADTNVGPQLNRMLGGNDILSADLTAIAVTEDTHTVIAVYREQNAPSENGLPDIDPTQPDAAFPQLEDHKRLIVTFDECGNFPIAAAQMQTGNSLDHWNYESYGQAPDGYNDWQDGMDLVRDPRDGREYAYFAVNDYGVTQFGAVVPTNSENVCAIVGPLVTPVIAPQAVATGVSSASVLGAVMAAPLVGMVGYLLTVKRRQANALATEDE